MCEPISPRGPDYRSIAGSHDDHPWAEWCCLIANVRVRLDRHGDISIREPDGAGIYIGAEGVKPQVSAKALADILLGAAAELEWREENE